MFYSGPMARGGYGQGTGIPLGERVRRTAGAGAEAPAAVTPDVPARHCWVAAPVDGTGPRVGLLLEWRLGRDGYEGLVVYASQLRPGRWATVVEWLPADVLSPRD
jgi:hypothetical protein